MRGLRLLFLLCGGAGVAYAPDGFRAVVGDHQGAITRDRYAYGASPNVTVRGYKAGEEILIFAGRMPGLMQGNANHFVAHTHRLIPRPVFGSENIALVFSRQLRAVIEGHLERSAMRLQQNIRSNDLVLQLGMLALVTRILVPADIPPWPAIEPAVLHVRDVVGNEIIAKRVTFIDRAPELARLGIDGESATGIANAGGVDAHARTVGVEFQNVRAIFLGRIRIRVIDIRARAHADIHFLAVRRKLDIARPVIAAAGQVRNMLRGS